MKRIISFVLTLAMVASLGGFTSGGIKASAKEAVQNQLELKVPEIGNRMIAAGDSHTVKLMPMEQLLQ